MNRGFEVTEISDTSDLEAFSSSEVSSALSSSEERESGMSSLSREYKSLEMMQSERTYISPISVYVSDLEIEDSLTSDTLQIC